RRRRRCARGRAARRVRRGGPSARGRGGRRCARGGGRGGGETRARGASGGGQAQGARHSLALLSCSRSLARSLSLFLSLSLWFHISRERYVGSALATATRRDDNRVGPLFGIPNRIRITDMGNCRYRGEWRRGGRR